MYATVAPNDDERTWGMYAHLSGMLAFTAVPFGGIIGPLVLYLQNRPMRPFAAEQAREALNFHITAGVAQLIAIVIGIATWVGMLVNVATLPKGAVSPLPGFGVVALACAAYFLVYLWTFILTLIGTIHASSGQLYRYPFTIRFVRS